MARFHAKFPFDLVIMLGDNIYGGQGASDLTRSSRSRTRRCSTRASSSTPRSAITTNPTTVSTRCGTWAGSCYYTYAIKNVRFFALDSNKVDPKELAWLENALKSAQEEWKICYFHHPLYSDGGTHGSAVDMRVVFEPLFVTYGVNVVFAGHDHIMQ